MESLKDSQSPPTIPTSESKDNKYAVLMETNGEELESWYYFLCWNGNEEVIKHLSAQLDEIDMYIDDELSTFDLDTEHLVNEETAKQMILLELNSVTFHRKFDGKMRPVNIGLKRKDSNEKRLKRLNDILGMQKIEEFIDQEDIPVDHVVSDEENDESDHEGDEDLVPMPLSS